MDFSQIVFLPSCTWHRYKYKFAYMYTCVPDAICRRDKVTRTAFCITKYVRRLQSLCTDVQRRQCDYLEHIGLVWIDIYLDAF